jgi:hypothetical protein
MITSSALKNAMNSYTQWEFFTLKTSTDSMMSSLMFCGSQMVQAGRIGIRSGDKSRVHYFI